MLVSSPTVYVDFQKSFQASFRKRVAGRPLFLTSATGLYEAYLGAMPIHFRQEHTCHCCRRFIESYGGLVYLEDGKLVSAFWQPDIAYQESFAAMAAIVQRAKITAVFHSADKVWGNPITGNWLHMAAPNPVVFSRPLAKDHEQIALSKEHFGMMIRALQDYKLKDLQLAVAMLESDAMYRTEKVLGPAKFLLDLQTAWTAKKNPNLIWSAIATAPEGFLHPRASMIGTLLDDLSGGISLEQATASFKAKMHPLQYQRSTAAPTSGAIAAAEKAMQELGLEKSLERRFARLDEVPKLWVPTAKESVSKGVFGHLLGSEAVTQLPGVTTVTWVKFLKEVLPKIDSMLAHTDGSAYSTILTATHADAPPILQWDEVEKRNPFSWYFYSGGTSAAQYNLTSHSWVKVNALVESPAKGVPNQEDKIMFVLDGAKDTRKPTLCLFPEILKGFMHPFRAVIEAHNRTAKPTGEGDVAGLFLSKSTPWNLRLKVTVADLVYQYKIDRWE